MNESATDTTRTKRTRIDPTAHVMDQSTTEQAKPVQQAPKALAYAFVKSHISSLHPQVASIVERFAIKHIDLLVKHANKANQSTKLTENDEFIPRSARIKFEFHMSDTASESDKFKTLNTETQNLILAFQQTLKAQVVKAIEIEASTFLLEIQTNFVEAVKHISKAFLVLESPLKNTHDVDTTVNHLMTSHGLTLLKYTSMTMPEFRTLYNTLHDAPSMLNEPTHERTAMVIINPYTQSQSQGAPLTQSDDRPSTQPIKRAMEAVFVTAFSQYSDQVKKNQISLQLQAYATEVFTDASTKAASDLLDKEPSADQETLHQLISKATAAAVADLTTQVKSLTDRLHGMKIPPPAARSTTAKNGQPRGPRGASSQQKSNRAPPTTPRPRSQSPSHSRRKQSSQKTPTGRKAKAAAASNATASNSPGNPSSRSKSPTRSNNKGSSSKSKTSPKQSGRR